MTIILCKKLYLKVIMNIMSLQRNEIPIENHSTQTKHSLQRNEIPIENHSTQTKHKRTSLLGSKRDQV